MGRVKEQWQAEVDAEAEKYIRGGMDPQDAYDKVYGTDDRQMMEQEDDNAPRS